MEPHVKENSSCLSNGGKNGEVGDEDEDDGSCEEEEEVTNLPVVASVATCHQFWNTPPSGESDLDVGCGGGCSGVEGESGARGRLDVVGNRVQLR